MSNMLPGKGGLKAAAPEPPAKPAEEHRSTVTDQAVLANIKAFAADAAYTDDRARSLAQVMSIMESKEAAKARKALAESAREKVTTAVDNFRRAGEKPKVELRSVAEKVKVNEAAPDKKAADKAVAAAEFQTLEELLMERRLLMRLGCYDDARRLDKRIDDARARREADRVETNKRVLEKKLAGLEMKQRVQRQQLLRRQAEELTEMQEAGAAELKNLMTLHAQEYHALYEQVTQAAAFEENAHMSDIGVSSRASRTIAKQRYRMSKELLNLRESVAKLNESGRDAQATEVLNTIREREHAEKSAWRDEFLKLALGAHDGSVLSQMLLGHKTAQAKLADKNERALVAARRAQVRARTRQEGTFRLEKWKVIDLCRKQGTAAYMAYRDDDGALGDDWKRKNMKVVEDDLEHGGVGQVIAARDDGTVWVAPTAFGLNNSDAIEYRDTLTVTEGAAQLNSLSAEDGMFRTLTKLFWLSEANSTLTALLLNTDATTYFRDFLSDEAPNFMVDLRFVLEVHAVKALGPDEQYTQMSELYYQKNGLTDGLTHDMAMKFANSECRRLIDKLARGCFEPFVGSEMCEALLEQMGRKWFAFKDVPQLKDRPWAELFTTALTRNRAPLLMVNVQVPGLPISWANEGFEALTGFNRAEAIGKNCRFLQGADTQQEAVAALSRGICSATRADVRIYNYRKNGTRFLNHVTLHPIHDMDGVFRYCVALLGDAEAEALQEKDQRTLLAWLPATFPSEAQEMGSLHGKRDDADDADGASAAFQRWEAQYARATVGLSKLALAHDAELRFPMLMGHQSVMEPYRAFCAASGHARQLEVWLAHEKAKALPPAEQGAAVRELLIASGIPVSRGGADLARELDEAAELARKALGVLASVVFNEWLKREDSTHVLATLLPTIPRSLQQYTSKLWQRYDPPPELVGWLAAFVEMAESHPMSMVISDMTIAGNPMIFVNKVFCTVTQYSREEALGRNCRFLQGPDTEPSAVSQIQGALRNGDKCFVKITNYRRSGQQFVNLLALQPIYDSNSLMRLCVGIQCEVTQAVGIQRKLERLAAMATLVPSRINVGRVKPPSVFAEYLRNKDRTKHRGDNMVEADTNLMVTDRLRRVLNQQVEIADAGDIRSGVRFGDNYASMMHELGADRSNDDDAAARARDADALEIVMTRVMWIGQAEALLERLIPLKAAYDRLVRFYTHADPSGAALLSLEFLYEISAMRQLGSSIRARRRSVALIKLARRAARGPKRLAAAALPPPPNKAKPAASARDKAGAKAKGSDSGSGSDSESDTSGSGSDKSESGSDKSGSGSGKSSSGTAGSAAPLPTGGARAPGDDDDDDDDDLGPEVTDSAVAMAEAIDKHAQVLRHMAANLFPVFVNSDAGTELISRAVREVHDAVELNLSDEQRGILSDLPIARAAPFPKVLAETLDSVQLGVILVDMAIPGLPIVWANGAFEAVTGYSPAEAHGRNCRFLQGPDTEPERVIEIVEAVRDGTGVTVAVTNYRKGGARFVCECLIHPIHDASGKYVYAVGMLLDRGAAAPPPVAGGGDGGGGSDSESDDGHTRVTASGGGASDGAGTARTLRDFLAAVLPSVIPARYAHPWDEDAPPPNPPPAQTELVAHERHECNQRMHAAVLRLAWLGDKRKASDALCVLTENGATYEVLKKFMTSVMPQRAPELKLFDIFDVNLEISQAMRNGDFATALSSARDLAELYADGDFADILGDDDDDDDDAGGGPRAPPRKGAPSRGGGATRRPGGASARGGGAAGREPGEGALLHEHADMRLCAQLVGRARARLARVDALGRFWSSAGFGTCIAAVHRPENLGSSKMLLWGAYELPSDAYAFVHGFTAAGQSFPFALTLSDMTLAGNPLVYVNQKFCELTGYAMGEMLGFNCRFLQGPRTEAKCIEAIQHALRRAIPCLVRLTNYRKDGSFFDQLLAIQPVHDSLGRFRFCIGVQAPVLPGSRAWLETYASALTLLPFTLHAPPFEPLPASSVRCKAYFGTELTFALAESQKRGGGGIEPSSASDESDASLSDGDSDADSNAPPRAAGGAQKPKGLKAAVPSFSTIEEPLQPFGERSSRTISAQLQRLLSGPPGGVVIAPPDESVPTVRYDKPFFEHNHDRHREELKEVVRELNEQLTKRRAARLAHLHRVRKGSATSYPGRRAADADPDALASIDPTAARDEAVRLTQLSWIDATGERLGALLASVAQLKPALVAFGAAAREPVDGANSDPRAREVPRLDRETTELVLDVLAAAALADAEELSDAIDRLESSMRNHWPPDVTPGTDDDDDATRLDRVRRGLQRPLRTMLHSIWPAFVLSEDGVELIDKLAGEAPKPPPRLTLFGFATTMLGQPWTVAFLEAAHSLPLATCVVDMAVAGLPIIFVNRAFEQLTGYTMIDAVGRNCRFLQRGFADSDAVGALSLSLREQQPTTQTIINYRKSGARFVNELSMVYVRGADGEVRYCIGLQLDVADAERSPELRELVARVIRLLPERLRCTAQEERELWEGQFGDADGAVGTADVEYGGAWSAPKSRRPTATTHAVRAVSESVRRRQYTMGVGAFTKLQWLADQEASFRDAMRNSPLFRELFGEYLATMGKRSAELSARWRLCCEELLLATLQPPADAELAERLYRECIFPYDSSFTPNPKYRVQLEAAKVAKEMAISHFVPFLQTAASDRVFETVELPVALDAASQLLWVDYHTPDDLKRWLWGFASAAATVDACVVISDMTLAGNPLIFVNEAFCLTTGYTKEEALGRNCRFLQGPETEPDAVHEIVSALRLATDCAVKLTNYRRSGETFTNLLVLRPVHDSSGGYRMCIGVQTELLAGVDSARKIEALARVVTVLPHMVEVEPSGRAGLMHTSWLAERARREGGNYDSFSALHAKLLALAQQPPAWMARATKDGDRERAVQGAVVALEGGFARPNEVSVVRFVNNHGRQLERLGVHIVADQFSRVRFLHDARATLRTMLRMVDGKSSFVVFMLRQAGARAALLVDTIVELRRLATADRYLVRMKCAELYERLHGRAVDPLEAQELLEVETETALLRYASDYYPQWVTSGFCASMLNQLRTVRNAKAELPLIRQSHGYLEMAKLALDAVPLAVAIVDTLVAGLPVLWTNPAFEWVTGYARDEAVGRNMRFLQGDDTEPEAVATIVEAVRAHAQTTVTLTNYRKDGERFENELTMLPIHDDKGTFRYIVALLRDAKAVGDFLVAPERADAAAAAEAADGRRVAARAPARQQRTAYRAVAKKGGVGGERDVVENAQLEALRKTPALTQSQLRELISTLLERSFPAHLQPRGWPIGKLMEPSEDASLEQARAVQVAFTKLDWLELPEKHFRESVVARDELRPFEAFLRARNLETTLRFWLAVSKLMGMSELARMAKADEAYKEYLEVKHAGDQPLGAADSKAKMEQIQAAFKRVTRELVDTHFVDFIYSDKSDTTVTRLMDDPTEVNESAFALLWPEYDVPADTSRFLAQFAALFDKYPACICLSDMTLPGSPMVFVNAGFCAITGYKTSEVLGKSCRFLQGPFTDPEAVAAIVRALRNGEDCHVKVANYTKAGVPFKSLLTLLAIFDSNGVYRFCMGIQFPITEQVTIRRRFMRLSRLVCLLPRMLEVGPAKPVGPMHPRARRLVDEHNAALAQRARKAAELAALGADLEEEAEREDADDGSGDDGDGDGDGDAARFEEEGEAGAPAAEAEGEDGAGGEAVGAPGGRKPKKDERRPVVDKGRWATAASEFGLPGPAKAELARDVSREASAHRLSSALMATREQIGTVVEADGSKRKVRIEAAPRVFRDNFRRFLGSLGLAVPNTAHLQMRGLIEGIDDADGDALDSVRTLEGFGAQEMYSKLMWMRHGTPELLQRLLAYPPAMANFKQYVRTVSHVSIEVIFYLEVVKLEEPMCAQDEQEIMAVFRRFLPAQRAPNGLAAYSMLREQASATLNMLASEFLLDFVKSAALVITFIQMRGIRELRGTAEAQELFLELPAKGNWQLPHVPNSRQLALLNREDEWVRVFHICLDNHELAIILVNMQLPGLPIIFANKAFSALTNFSQAEVLGQNCSFLQGAATDAASVREVKAATQELRSGARVELLNYRNNGEAFRNILSLGFTREYPGGPAKYAVGILVERTHGSGTLVTQSQLRKAQEFISILPRATRAAREAVAASMPSAAERTRVAERARPTSAGARLTGASAAADEPGARHALVEFNADKWLHGAVHTIDRLLRLVPEGRDVFSEFVMNQYFHEAFSKGVAVPKGRRGGGGLLGSAMASKAGLASRAAFASKAQLGKSSAAFGGGARVSSAQLGGKPAASRAGLSMSEMKGGATRATLLTATRASLTAAPADGSNVVALNPNELGVVTAAMRMAMDVRLSLHSTNPLRERSDYGEGIVAFWLAVEQLKGLSGETLRQRAADTFRAFALPELGMRRAEHGQPKLAAQHVPEPSVEGESETHADGASTRRQQRFSARAIAPATGADGEAGAVAQYAVPVGAAAGARLTRPAERAAATADDGNGNGFALARHESTSTVGDTHVLVAELQRLLSLTMQLLAFDLLPAFLRSRLLTGLASSLMQTSKDPELELAIRVSRSTAPQDADDWMKLFCTAAEDMRTAVIVCDMIKPGVPIMYVNKAFEQMTEFPRSEAIGRNCRFLQGKQTDPNTVARIGAAIRQGQPINVKLINYRKSGQPFLNLISLQPICDRDGLFRFMLGTNCEISEKYTPALKSKLMHMDRLVKLVPTVLELPSSVDTKARAELVRETLMQPVLKPYKLQPRSGGGGGGGASRASFAMSAGGAKRGAMTRSNLSSTKQTLGAGGGGAAGVVGAAALDADSAGNNSRFIAANRPSVAVLSLGSSSPRAPPLGMSGLSSMNEASADSLGRPNSGSRSAARFGKGGPSDANARAGRVAGDSEARQGKSILSAVRLNLRHALQIDGVGDPIDGSAQPSTPPQVASPRPPPGAPGLPNPVRTLSSLMVPGAGGPAMAARPGVASFMLPSGAKPPGAPSLPPGKAAPAAPPARPPPGRPGIKGKAPEPPPAPVKEDKDAHLKKTAADVDMSALLNGSDSDEDSDDSTNDSDSDDGSDDE